MINMIFKIKIQFEKNLKSNSLSSFIKLAVAVRLFGAGYTVRVFGVGVTVDNGSNKSLSAFKSEKFNSVLLLFDFLYCTKL